MVRWWQPFHHLLACCGGGATSGWRRLLVVSAAAATVLELAFFAPLQISMWISSPYHLLYPTNNATANSSSLESFSDPLIPPPLSQSSTLLSPTSELSLMTYNFTVNQTASVSPSTLPPPASELFMQSLNSSSVELSAGNVTVSLSSPPRSSHSVYNSSWMKVNNSSRSEEKLLHLSSKDSIREMSITQQLKYAKKEIEKAPVVLNDPDLHATLFHNLSAFKRSYELMERILKIYIYEDGQGPVFHTPVLSGIYASEGWFMKLLEENEQFVTKDPNKAHLFYLPYSSKQLRTHVYDYKLHNRKSLRIFLTNYVNMISAKYPFWKRSRGTDHFLVACHDWASYSTKFHLEFRRKTIKAICNADVSDGVFVHGKDVTLPETKISKTGGPQWDIGGEPGNKRFILAFYAGRMHGHVRPILLRHWKGKDKDMRIYEVLPDNIARNMSYSRHMKSSKFCICPRGYEVNSPRIVESIYYECVPVIIADNFVLPFDEVLNWSAFSIVIAEKDIPKLKEILVGVTSTQYTAMQMNIKRLQKHFLWNTNPRKYDLFHMILHSIWFARLNQIKIYE